MQPSWAREPADNDAPIPAEARGRILVDLLELVDAMPPFDDGADLEFPPFRTLRSA